ncbi:DNAJC10 [Symbiodinium pilosum]|uniref:DnaJ homolog subfamily C member 16 n=1 Tax=Symbiodinium pilosum TaxID=2952 RepID=A0A812WPT2_SYMPI|nr:DNAJC10 [Symbiodinium pilosum]
MATQRGGVQGARSGGMTHHIQGPHLIPNVGREAMLVAEVIRRRPKAKSKPALAKPQVHATEKKVHKKERKEPKKKRRKESERSGSNSPRSRCSRSRTKARERDWSAEGSEEEEVEAFGAPEETPELMPGLDSDREARRIEEERKQLQLLKEVQEKRRKQESERKKNLGGIFALSEDDFDKEEHEQAKRAQAAQEEARSEKQHLRHPTSLRGSQSRKDSTLLDESAPGSGFDKCWKNWDFTKAEDPAEVARQFMRVTAAKRRGYGARERPPGAPADLEFYPEACPAKRVEEMSLEELLDSVEAKDRQQASSHRPAKASGLEAEMSLSELLEVPDHRDSTEAQVKANLGVVQEETLDASWQYWTAVSPCLVELPSCQDLCESRGKGGAPKHRVNAKQTPARDEDSLLVAPPGKWTDAFIILKVLRWAACQGLELYSSGPVAREKKSDNQLPTKAAALQFAESHKVPLGLIATFVITCAIIIGGENLDRLPERQVEAEDHYGLLGVTRDAQAADIKRAYKTMAKRWHPDKNPNCSSCQETFSKIAVAYETLSDDSKRAAYDEAGGAAASELTSPKSVPLNKANFDELVTFSNDVWIVQVFRPDNHHCASFHPFWENQIQKYQHLVRFGRIDVTDDQATWLPLKIRVLPTVLKFARHLGAVEIFPVTQMHETPQALTKFVLTSFPNIGLPLSSDRSALTSWLSRSTRRHKVLFAIPGKSEEERYKSHLVPRKLAARWSEVFEVRSAETELLHSLPAAQVVEAIPSKESSGEKAAALLFPAGGTEPKAMATFSWPTGEEEIVMELMRFTEMVGVSLTVQSAELLCRSLAMQRVYCLVLLDSSTAALSRAARDLRESRAEYQSEVAQIRASGGEVSEDEAVDKKHGFGVRPGLDLACRTYDSTRVLLGRNFCEGGKGACWFIGFPDGPLAQHGKKAYEDSLNWVDALDLRSLPDCSEVELTKEVRLAVFLAEILAKAVASGSLLWSPPFLRWSGARCQSFRRVRLFSYVPEMFQSPELLVFLNVLISGPELEVLAWDQWAHIAKALFHYSLVPGVFAYGLWYSGEFTLNPATLFAVAGHFPPRPWTGSRKWKHRRKEVEPLEKTGKKVNVSAFYAFMWRREGLRRRRELLRLPPEKWTKDNVMARIRLTNVKREDDRTTRVMRRICNNYVDRHPELRELRKIPVRLWDSHLQMSARWLVFNFALWRAFGTDTFAESIGFLTNRTWSKDVQQTVVQAAIRRWSSGHFNYTDAYDPCRSNRHDERNARLCGGVGLVQHLYSRTCASLAGLWQACDDIAGVAVTSSSWQKVTRCVMRVSGYGGTGFLAKELVQDLLHTPLFQSWSPQQAKWVGRCVDLNSWCAVGPGARRGLNRLYGRRVNWNAYCDDDRVAHQFLRELQEVFEDRKKYWHGDLEGFPIFDLELHDVQFQLCELDKYEREKKKPGQVRPYLPPKVDLAEVAELEEEDSEDERVWVTLAKRAKPLAPAQIVDEDVKEDAPEEAREERLKSFIDSCFADFDRNASKVREASVPGSLPLSEVALENSETSL